MATSGSGRYRLRVLVVVQTLALLSGLLSEAAPAKAGAAPAGEPVAAQAPADRGATAAAVVSGVNGLFAEGKSRFDQQDYDGALVLWTRAYEDAPATPAGRAFRVGMAPHLALAHEYRFRQTGSLSDLRRTSTLLQWHVDHYKALYKPSPEARDHITEITRWRGEVDGQLARLTAPGPAPVVTPAPRPVKRPRPSNRQVQDELYADPELHGTYSAGRGMMAGGAVMVATGGILSLVALGTLDGDQPPFMSFAGLGLIGGGVALMVVGGKRKRTATLEARRRVTLLPTGHGLLLSGRF